MKPLLLPANQVKQLVAHQNYSTQQSALSSQTDNKLHTKNLSVLYKVKCFTVQIKKFQRLQTETKIKETGIIKAVMTEKSSDANTNIQENKPSAKEVRILINNQSNEAEASNTVDSDERKRRMQIFRKQQSIGGTLITIIDLSKWDEQESSSSSSPAPPPRRVSIKALNEVVAWPDAVITIVPVKIYFNVAISNSFNLKPNESFYIRYKLTKSEQDTSGAENTRKLDLKACGENCFIGYVCIEIAKETFNRTPVLRYDYVARSSDNDDVLQEKQFGGQQWRQVNYASIEKSDTQPATIIHRNDVAVAEQFKDKQTLIDETALALRTFLHYDQDDEKKNTINETQQKGGEYARTRSIILDVLEHCKRIEIEPTQAVFNELQQYFVERVISLHATFAKSEDRNDNNKSLKYYENVLSTLAIANTFEFNKFIGSIKSKLEKANFSVPKYYALFLRLPRRPKDSALIAYKKRLEKWFAPQAREFQVLLLKTIKVTAQDMHEDLNFYSMYLLPAYHIMTEALQTPLINASSVRYNQEAWWSIDANVKGILKPLKQKLEKSPVTNAAAVMQTLYHNIAHVIENDDFMQKSFLYLLTDDMLSLYVSKTTFTLENVVARFSMQIGIALSKFLHLNLNKKIAQLLEDAREIADRLPHYTHAYVDTSASSMSLASMDSTTSPILSQADFGNLQIAADAAMDAGFVLYDYASKDVLHVFDALLQNNAAENLLDLAFNLFNVAYSVITHYTVLEDYDRDSALMCKIQRFSNATHVFLCRALSSLVASVDKQKLDCAPMILLVKMWHAVQVLTPRRSAISSWLYTLQAALHFTLSRRKPDQKLQLYCRLEELAATIKKLTGETIPTTLHGTITAFAFQEVDAGQSDVLQLPTGLLSSKQRYFELLARFVQQVLPFKAMSEEEMLFYVLRNRKLHDVLRRLNDCASQLSRRGQTVPALIQRLNSLLEVLEPVGCSALLSGHVTLKNLEIICQNADDYIACMVAVQQYTRAWDNTNASGWEVVEDEASGEAISSSIVEFKLRSLLKTRENEMQYFFKMLNLVTNAARAFDRYPHLLSALKRKTNINSGRLTLQQVVQINENNQNQRNENPRLTFIHIDDSTLRLLECLNSLAESQILRSIVAHTLELLAEQSAGLVTSFGNGSEQEPTDEEVTQDLRAATAFLWLCITDAAKQFEAIQEGRILAVDLREIINTVFDNRINHFEHELQYLDRQREALETAKRQPFQKPHGAICEPLPKGSEDWISLRVRQSSMVCRIDKLIGICQLAIAVKDTCQLSGDFSAVERIALVETFSRSQLHTINDAELRNAEELLQIAVNEEEMTVLQMFMESHVTQLVKWLRREVPRVADFETLIEMALSTVQSEESVESQAKIFCVEQAVNGYLSLVYIPSDAGLKEVVEAFSKVLSSYSIDHRLPKQIQDAARLIEWLKSIKTEHRDVELTIMQVLSAFQQKSSFRIGLSEGKTAAKPDDLLICRNLMQVTNAQPIMYTLSELRTLRLKATLLSSIIQVHRNAQETSQSQVQLLGWFSDLVDALESVVLQLSELLNSAAFVFKSFLVLINVSVNDSSLTLTSNHPAMTFDCCCVLQNTDQITPKLDAIGRALHSCLQSWRQRITELRFQYPEVNTFSDKQLATLADSLAPVWQSVRTKAVHHEIFTPSNTALSIISGAFRVVCTKELLIRAFQKIIERQADEKRASVSSSSAPSAVVPPPPSSDVLHELIVSEWQRSEKLELELNVFNIASLCSTLSELLRIVCGENMRLKVSRRVPNSLSDKVPNLVIYDSETPLIPLLLSIYQLATPIPAGVNASSIRLLPTSEELLVCTNETDAEQIDLLIKRAMLSPSFANNDQPLYCIAITKSANTELSRRIGECLKQPALKSRSRQPMNLVIVCEDEIAADFRAMLEVQETAGLLFSNPDSQSLRKYVSRQLDFEQNLMQFPSLCFNLSELSTINDWKRRIPYTVRVIESNYPSSGKSLNVQRCVEEFQQMYADAASKRELPKVQVIPLFQRTASTREFFSNLPNNHSCSLFCDVPPCIFHIDVVNSNDGLEYILFNLIILDTLTDASGNTWLRSPFDLFLIEHTKRFERAVGSGKNRWKLASVHSLLSLLPSTLCNSPSECSSWLKIAGPPPKQQMQFVDSQLFYSPEYQLPFKYLRKIDAQDSGRKELATDANNISLFLRIVQSYCGTKEPSWYEVRNFLHFLHEQLVRFEHNSFLQEQSTDSILPGFRDFVLRFTIALSQDFATRSLVISEAGKDVAQADKEQNLLVNLVDTSDAKQLIAQYQMRRTWEVSKHAYIFFNADNQTMTFFDFQLNIRKYTKKEIDKNTPMELINGLPGIQMGVQLYIALRNQQIKFDVTYEKVAKQAKLAKLIMLWKVFGVNYRKKFHAAEKALYESVLNKLEDDPDYDRFDAAQNFLIGDVTNVLDPDSTYELTMDNTRKILAIYMRITSGLPVIVMGETGCGKTTMIEYLCRLLTMDAIRNIVVARIHGGVKEKDLQRVVAKAERLAQRNYTQHQIQTVLFLDEANSSEVIHLIKELICDKRFKSRSLNPNLRVVCAVNPYRMHKASVIERLERAGLGYHLNNGSPTNQESFGPIPMRHLVYRVHPLPHSLLPFVWDFGKLDENTELLYIHRIAHRYFSRFDDEFSTKLHETTYVNAVCKLIQFCQRFMNEITDESVFVSLRNVVRVLEIYGWLLRHSDFLLLKIDAKLLLKLDDCNMKPELRCITLSIMINYYVSLQNTRDKFIRTFADELVKAFPKVATSAIRILREFETLQEVVIEECGIGSNVVPNAALKENVLVMVICIDLRIPLFIVGKPGTSKSLSREIVRSAMQGINSSSRFFASLKVAYFVNLQCNQSTTANGIIKVFRQCVQMQKKNKLDALVGVAVLDELGLVEDSPELPLKTLHSLLDGGCEDESDDENDEDDDDSFETPEYKKVAFVGLSNWSIDPAKTNRGILVQRDKFDEEELYLTAEGLCRANPGDDQNHVFKCVQPYLRALCKAYLQVYERVGNDFFGLRDFYSLISMLVREISERRATTNTRLGLTWQLLRYVVLRNFDAAAYRSTINPLDIFAGHLRSTPGYCYNVIGLDSNKELDRIVMQVLRENAEAESANTQFALNRSPLIIVDDACSLQVLIDWLKQRQVEMIIGSAFPGDQGSYNRLCRDLQRVKLCIELGRPCALIGIPELYDCMYDALNQSFSYLGGDRYVNLSFGEQRVKCKLHERFRLIVLATRTEVRQFPIPLLNRLEKHRFSSSMMLSDEQSEQLERFKAMLATFAGFKPKATIKTENEANSSEQNYKPYATQEVIIGLEDTMLPAVLLAASTGSDHDVVSESFRLAIDCATAESVIRFCSFGDDAGNNEDSKSEMPKTSLAEKLFWDELGHKSFTELVCKHFTSANIRKKVLHVSTFSALLTWSHLEALRKVLEIALKKSVTASLLMVDSIATQASFNNILQNELEPSAGALDSFKLLVLQCEHSNKIEPLIFSSHSVLESFLSSQKPENCGVIFITKVFNRTYKFFRYGAWRSAHMDVLFDREKVDWPSFRSHTELVSGSLSAYGIQRRPLRREIFEALISAELETSALDELLSDILQVAKLLPYARAMPHQLVGDVIEDQLHMNSEPWRRSILARCDFSVLEAAWNCLLFLKAKLQKDQCELISSRVSTSLDSDQLFALQIIEMKKKTNLAALIFEAVLMNSSMNAINTEENENTEVLEQPLKSFLGHYQHRTYRIDVEHSAFDKKVVEQLNKMAQLCKCGIHQTTVEEITDVTHCIRVKHSGSLFNLLLE